MNAFELSRNWFDFTFENTEMVKPVHTALYFYIIDHANRLGWLSKFGLPTEVTMTAVGIKNYKTYAKALDGLIDWGFIVIHQRSKNQYTCNIIALVKNTKAVTKAHAIALSKHNPEHVRSIVDINKPYNQKTFELINEGEIPPAKIKVNDLIIENALGWNGLIRTFSKISGLGPEETKSKMREFLEKEKAVDKEYINLSDLKSHLYSKFEILKNKKVIESGPDLKKNIDDIEYNERIGEKLH